MKAVVYHQPGSPLVLETWNDPTPAPNELVVRVHRCGVCGTDLTMTSGEGPGYPCHSILGHEFSGEVVAMGTAVNGYRAGDRITSMGFVGCGNCKECREGNPLWCQDMRGVAGGFAEYALCPADVSIKLPESLSLDDGALVEPMACALHAVNRVAPLGGNDVLVLGAGAIGLGVTFWARRMGAGNITVSARSDTARDRAMMVGADQFLSTNNLAFDSSPPAVVFECTGAPGLMAKAIELVRPRGTVVLAGLCAETDSFLPAFAMMKEVRLLFAVAYSLPEFQHTTDALERETINLGAAFVGDVISLDGLPEAFEALRKQHARGKLTVMAR